MRLLDRYVLLEFVKLLLLSLFAFVIIFAIVDLFEKIQDFMDGHASALIVAHNPGIHEAALTLSQPINGQAPSETALDLQNGFPPASMAVFECKIRQWADVNNETATLRHLVKAR